MELLKQKLQESVQLKSDLIHNPAIQKTVQEAATVMLHCLQQKGSIWWAGNGGSAADAQHLSAELTGRFYYDRKPLPSEALHVNTSFLTAVANDYSYDEVYARLLEGMGKKGDVLIGLSTSGNSKNVVNAFIKANQLGIHTIAFTGLSGGKLKEVADLCINIPSTDTPRIQECHMIIGHTLCEFLEIQLFPKK